MSNLLLLGAGGPPIVESGPTLWTPNDEAGLLGWWDMSNLANYNSTDGWIARWGTLGNWLVSDVGPTEISNGFSGDKNALVFTDTSDTGLYIDEPNVTELVLVIAANIVTTAATYLVFNRGVSGVGVQGLLGVDSYGMQVKYRGGTDAEYYSMSTPGQYLIGARFSSAHRVLRLNGEEVSDTTVSNTGTAPNANDSLELFRDAADSGYSIQVAAVGIFTSASFSDDLMERIEGFICHNNLGHTTSILPIGHPYKTNAPTL
jgi:hypothetical protein